MTKSSFLQRCLGVAVVLLSVPAHGAGAGKASAPAVDFARDIQPILSDNCYHCHGPDAGNRKAKLRLDTADGVFKKELKSGGLAVVAGQPDKSEIIARVETDDADDQMPPPDSNRKLTEAQKKLLRKWVEEGGVWAKHWSLVSPKRPELPTVKNTAWSRNAIDRFVLAKLEAEGLRPSPEATRETLLRRVTLDLTGLPPTLVEIDAFLADKSPGAYEKVVDRLLASPRYGERMVWEWLDAARYADTNGYQGDQTRTMWPWRDWAITAINNNMPYDQFTVEQIAGDLLPDSTNDQKIATGFCRNHMINGEGGRIAEENRVDYVMDQAETVSTVWLGLTVGCARCHDHKFDPISQKEYYQLYAYFNNTPVTGGGGSGQTDPVVDLATSEQKAQIKANVDDVKKKADKVVEIEKVIFAAPEGKTEAESPNLAGVSGSIIATLKQRPEKRYLPTYRNIIPALNKSQPEYAAAAQAFVDAIDAREKLKAKVPRVMVMAEMPKPRDSFILTKGAYDKPTEKVAPGTLAVLPPLPADAPKNRLALAKWFVSPEHPLTARVTVNRYWQQFFGYGIVKTVEDFGAQGEKPVNPELLDWLATEFISSGWNVKAMHRLIVTSATYRQSSKMTAAMFERDPENRLSARGPRFRLPAFMIRDQALAASGLLVEHLGGPPVKTYQPPGIWEEATFGQIKFQQDHGESLYRRSLYTFWRRIVGPTEFFDAGARQTCTVRPSRTNTPLHALTTLNDVTFVEAARALAQRVTHEASTPQDRIDLAYRLLLARRPSEAERAVLLKALNRLESQYGSDPTAAAQLLQTGESKRDERLDATEQAAYTGLCLAILNLDETLTKE